MHFKCFICKRTIDISYDMDPVNGNIMMRPWYVEDETGLNHQAVLCLKCFTVHDTSGSTLRFVFQSFLSRPLKIHCAIRPINEGIVELTYSSGNSELINSFPADIINLLVKNKKLGGGIFRPTIDL
jgi:hypothetical protein